ncbi:MAG: GDSL family lipase [Nitrospirae bacterium]|nr:GDSL family lipase [Nitrospirota bacterium]
MAGEKLVFLGDSLTEFFDWQKRFPEFEVMNLGISGETVEGLLARLDRVTSRVRNPDLVFLMTGINDIAMEEYEITAAYRKVLDILTASFKNSHVVVQSLLPVRLPWISNNEIVKINRSLQEIAGELRIVYLDIYRFFVDTNGNPVAQYLMEDGVHLSAAGYNKWSRAIEDFLVRRFEE